MNYKKRYQKTNAFLTQVKERIPLGAQTFSKSERQFVKKVAPLFLTHGRGAHVWDIDGNEYIDYINGLLAIILGYQYPAVDNAIKRQLKKGVAFSLSSPLEYELAQLLHKHIPCAEMARFGKNGSDVTTAAIRLSRAITGRDHVAVCGYHGWHDWYIGSTARNRGVPGAVKKLTHTFTYNDPSSLEKILKQYKCAAVMLEPMNYAEPNKTFLTRVKALARKHDAILVFDEVITGFRYHIGGAQKLFGVTPDLATFGKSMANGMPISVIVGKRKYMKHMSEIFFSVTHGGEALSIAAAIATIKEMEKKKVRQRIWEKGRYLQSGTERLLKKHGLSDIIEVAGKPCWQIFMVKDDQDLRGIEIKSYIQQEVLARGILWYGQHNISFSHTKKDLDRTLHVYDEVFKNLRAVLDEGTLRRHMMGAPITDILRISKR
jgi:glutamate-1-semialdehyde 2,1-aminomutase